MITVPNNGDLDVLIRFDHPDGADYSLVGVSRLLMQVRRQASDVAAVLHLSSDDGSLAIVGNPAAGEIRARKSWSEIHHLSGTYDFDIVVIASNFRRPIYRDQITFAAGVTR